MKILVKITPDILKESMFCNSKNTTTVGQNCAIGHVIDWIGIREAYKELSESKTLELVHI